MPARVPAFGCRPGADVRRPCGVGAARWASGRAVVGEWCRSEVGAARWAFGRAVAGERCRPEVAAAGRASGRPVDVRAVLSVPPGTAARLATTRPSPPDQALLERAQHSRRLVLVKALHTRVRRERLPPADRAAFERDWRLLLRAEAGDPRAARSVLDHPSVGSWLVHALGAAGPASLAAALPHLGEIAVAVALRSGVPLRTTLTAPGGRLVLPGLGVHGGPASRVRVRSVPRGLLLTPLGHRSARVLVGRRGGGLGRNWRGLPVLPGSRARLDDLAVLRAPDATVRGGAAAAAGPVREWLARWRAAIGLLRAADPGRAAEITGMLRSVVPMRDGAGASSGTLRSEPWAVHTVLPPTALRFAEVLVHETQHSKLDVLSDLVQLHRADAEPRYAVAWRSDPRPFAGVLQGTYAHLSLADLFGRLAAREGVPPARRGALLARREEYREQVASALPILLESCELTPAGREFVSGMQRHHASLARRAQAVRRGG